MLCHLRCAHEGRVAHHAACSSRALIQPAPAQISHHHILGDVKHRVTSRRSSRHRERADTIRDRVGHLPALAHETKPCPALRRWQPQQLGSLCSSVLPHNAQVGLGLALMSLQGQHALGAQVGLGLALCLQGQQALDALSASHATTDLVIAAAACWGRGSETGLLVPACCSTAADGGGGGLGGERGEQVGAQAPAGGDGERTAAERARVQAAAGVGAAVGVRRGERAGGQVLSGLVVGRVKRGACSVSNRSCTSAHQRAGR